jgi:arylsulfatase A-like enzyme
VTSLLSSEVSSSDPAAARARLHPLVVACLAAIVARAVGIVLHYTSHDPNGNPISASPFETLVIALPYHGAVLLTGTAILLGLWKLLPRARWPVTAVGLVLAPLVVVVGQIDLGMQWFIGQRFSPSAASTYVGASVLSSDVLGPLLFHRTYLMLGVALMVAPIAAIAWSVAGARRAVLHEPGWRLIGGVSGLAALSTLPIWLAYGHQLDVLRPPELMYTHRLFLQKDVPAPADSVAAIAELRAQIDPTGTQTWIDPALPAVRAGPPARNRFLGDAPPRVLPDVFVFAVESLRGGEVGYVPGNYPDGRTPTPNLDALARRGVVFSHYISTGNPSPRGFFGINTGVWDHRESFLVSGAMATEFDALPLRMRRAGYYALGVWGSNPSFDNQLYWAKKWYDHVWGVTAQHAFSIVRNQADDVVFDHLIQEVGAHDAARPDQPIFAYVANAGTHEPYEIGPGTLLPDSLVRAVSAEKDPELRYRMVLHEFDAQMGRFLSFLRARGSSRPLVIVVVGDHSDLAGDSIPPDLRGQPHDAAEWTSGLIFAPERWIGPPRVETFPAGHADLMPTLLDLIGDHGPIVAMGTDLFADVPPETRTALSNSGWGYRLDRDGWTLIVKRLQPDQVYTVRSFAPLSTAHEGLEGSPFTAADARRLWESQNTWSWLIEHDRVWRPSLLDAHETITPAAGSPSACGSPRPSGAAASPGCATGSRPAQPRDTLRAALR